jgi:hypothetical protein
MKNKITPLKILLSCATVLMVFAFWSFLYFWVCQDWLRLPEKIANASIIGILPTKISLGVLSLFFSLWITKKIMNSPKRTPEEIEYDDNEENGYGHISRQDKDPQK